MFEPNQHFSPRLDSCELAPTGLLFQVAEKKSSWICDHMKKPGISAGLLSIRCAGAYSGTSSYGMSVGGGPTAV